MKLAERYEYNPSTDRLGKGGFGTVYKALDLERDELVALKFVQKSKIPERYTLAQEIERIKRLEHPNLVKYYDILRKEYQNVAGEIDEMQIGVMEYVNGGDLAAFLKMANRRKPETLRKILVGILQGLGYLHDNRFIHRDIKPQNILLQIDNQVVIPKLADFSLSKELSQEMTSVSAAVGTYEYMSPEQLGNERSKINAQTDIWAFGVMCYQVLTGELPFGSRRAGISDAQIIANIMKGQLPEALPELPEPFPEIIQNCLQIDLAKRYQSVAPILELLGGGEDNTVNATDLSETLPTTGSSFFEENVEAEATEIPEVEEKEEAESAAPTSIPEDKSEDKTFVSAPTSIPEEEAVGEVQETFEPSATTTIPEEATEEEKEVPENAKNNKGALALVLVLIAFALAAIAWVYLSQPRKTDSVANNDKTSEADSAALAEAELNKQQDSLAKLQETPDEPQSEELSEKPEPVRRQVASPNPDNFRTPRNQENKAPNPEQETAPRDVEYDYTESYSSGSIVRLNGKYGYIDPEGRQIIPLQYEDFVNFSSGLAAVKKNGKWGFINKRNQVVIAFRYSRPGSFRNGEAQVWLGEQKIYINTKGQCVRNCP